MVQDTIDMYQHRDRALHPITVCVSQHIFLFLHFFTINFTPLTTNEAQLNPPISLGTETNLLTSMSWSVIIY